MASPCGRLNGSVTVVRRILRRLQPGLVGRLIVGDRLKRRIDPPGRRLPASVDRDRRCVYFKVIDRAPTPADAAQCGHFRVDGYAPDAIAVLCERYQAECSRSMRRACLPAQSCLPSIVAYSPISAGFSGRARTRRISAVHARPDSGVAAALSQDVACEQFVPALGERVIAPRSAQRQDVGAKPWIMVGGAAGPRGAVHRSRSHNSVSG